MRWIRVAVVTSASNRGRRVRGIGGYEVRWRSRKASVGIVGADGMAGATDAVRRSDASGRVVLVSAQLSR